MNNVFICHTPYHLLISVIKTLLNNRLGFDDIILCEKESIAEGTIKKLYEKKIFREIHLCTLKTYEAVTWKEKIFCSNKHLKKRMLDSCEISLDFFKNKNIFIFNDQCTIGKWFCIFKIKYNLLEDGCDHFKIPSSTNIPQTFFRTIDKLFGVCTDYPMGLCPYIQSIEVNDINNLRFSSTKFKEQSKDSLFKKLNKNQKNEIINIFLPSCENYKIKKNSTLLITQPLFEDNLLNHKAKIALYSYLLKKYGKENIYIKPHPREKENYTYFFPNATIIKENKIPLEVILLNSTHSFDNAITAYSTAIHGLNQIQERIYFGFEETFTFAKSIKE